MKDKLFLDTNILVYLYDRSDSEKQKRALELLDRLTLLRTGVLSTQVLAEFFVAVTRKIKTPLTIDEAYGRIKNYLRSWLILNITPLIILEAVRGVKDHNFSFWDSQIWATAKLNQIPTILTEDFSDGAIIEGIKFVNPFSKNFELKKLYPF